MKSAVWENIFRGRVKEQSKEVLALKQVPVFDGLDDRQMADIERVVHHRTYKPDEYVFRRNSPGEGLYIILQGKVKILSETDDGESHLVASLSEGDFFGDLSLLDEEPRSANAVATDHAELLGFFRPDLTSILKRKPDLGVKILFNVAKVIGERLRKTNELLEKSQDKRQE